MLVHRRVRSVAASRAQHRVYRNDCSTARATDEELGELAGQKTVIFGRRKVTPRACVADGKRHLRAFLSEVLEDLGFVTSECASADELQAMLANELPDLILLG